MHRVVHRNALPINHVSRADCFGRVHRVCLRILAHLVVRVWLPPALHKDDDDHDENEQNEEHNADNQPYERFLLLVACNSNVVDITIDEFKS